MLSPIEEQVVQAGLVDIDATFLVQLSLFLVFFATFSALVVKPLIRTYQLRYERMEGARQAAAETAARAKSAADEYKSKIDDAKKGSVHLRNDLKNAADEKARALLSGVQSESARQLESGREGIEADATAARSELDGQVESLAQLVAARVLGEEAA